MATVVQTKMQRFLSSAGWHHFVRSNYVTWFTEWLLSFGGKSAHVILIFTTLYMSAELYPGVHLPDGISIAVFLIQMFALDMGGMGLASLSRQAHVDGNEEGARSAKHLSNWLIGIMIAGLVTVCLEQAMNHLPHMETVQGYVDAAKIFVELVLVIARAVCAVLYGKVIHSLRGSWTMPTPAAQPEPIDYSQIVTQVSAQIQTNITQQLQEFTQQTQTKLDEVLAQNPAQTSPQSEANVTPDPAQNSGETQSEFDRETDPNLHAVSPKTRRQTRSTSSNKTYAITKREAALQCRCSLKDIEKGIEENRIKLYANTDKVLVSSLKGFASRRRLKVVNS